MPSRKRNKGKERKANAASVAALTEESKWEKWTRLGPSICGHGCVALPSKDHVVSRFLNDYENHYQRLTSDHYNHHSFKDDAKKLFVDHPGVWMNPVFRNMTIGILCTTGANMILEGDSFVHPALGIALMVILLEHGERGFDVAFVSGSGLARDLGTASVRETIRFYEKRIPCSCLKKRYSEAKELQPVLMCACTHCGQEKKRSSLMLCGGCKLEQYCGRECQKAAWPAHKVHCALHREICKRA